MTDYVYHLLPDPMEGTVLYPLNNLKTVSSEQYTKHAQKYSTRQELREQFIPILECRWNDVLHFSPIDPRIVLSELRKVDADIEIKRPRCLRLQAEALDDLPTAYMKTGKNSADGKFDSNLSDFERFHSLNLLKKVDTKYGIGKYPLKGVLYAKENIHRRV